MAYVFPGERALDYSPCRYGTSRLVFRGPQADLSGDYIAVLGGTETYGKYLPTPFPSLIGPLPGFQIANLGCMNAGPDAFLGDSGVIEIARQARAVVLQVMGAQNLSNRLYMVHPRRNDRFIAARPALRALYPEVDFTEFHFTHHMLASLLALSESRFDLVIEELRTAWVARMRALMSRLPGDVVLLWIAQHPPRPMMRATIRPGLLPPAPQAGPDSGPGAGPAIEPLLIDAEMASTIRPLASAWIEVACPNAAEPGDAPPVAPGLPGLMAHRTAAEALTRVLSPLLYPKI